MSSLLKLLWGYQGPGVSSVSHVIISATYSHTDHTLPCVTSFKGQNPDLRTILSTKLVSVSLSLSVCLSFPLSPSLNKADEARHQLK